MFLDRQLLRRSLAKTIGYYQSNNADLPTLSPSLTQSDYDRFVNSVHPLLTLENIDASVANFTRYPYDDYQGDTVTYSQEDVVQDGGIVYEAIQNVPISIPLTDVNYWFEMDDLNQYLYQMRLTGVDKVLDQVFNAKKMRTKVKSIFENIPLYDGTLNPRDLEVNANKFVGLRFIMKSDRDIVTVLNKVSTAFTEASTFTLYLLHSSQQEPIASVLINHTKPNSSQWVNLTNITLRWLDDNYDAGGEFFLGYAQSEIGTAQAINLTDTLDFYNGFGCGGCGGRQSRNYNYYKNYSKWVQVSSFSIDESAFTLGSTMFDPQNAAIGYDRSFGLNLNLTTKCDLTPFAIQEADIYAEGIQMATGLELMRNMANGVRTTNQLSNVVQQQAEKEVVSFNDVSGTLFDYTNDTIKGLSFDLSGLQSECLTCDDGQAEVMLGTRTLY